MMDREIRLNVHTVTLGLAWLAAACLLAAACWLDEWRFGVAAVVSAVIAGVLAVQRDNAKTRRVIRAVVRQIPDEHVRGIR